MPELNLELEIVRKGRHEYYLDARADPGNINLLRGILINWLESNGWSEGRWGEFELLARFSGEGKVRTRVRAR
jgi:hypothetical protein